MGTTRASASASPHSVPAAVTKAGPPVAPTPSPPTAAAAAAAAAASGCVSPIGWVSRYVWCARTPCTRSTRRPEASGTMACTQSCRARGGPSRTVPPTPTCSDSRGVRRLRRPAAAPTAVGRTAAVARDRRGSARRWYMWCGGAQRARITLARAARPLPPKRRLRARRCLSAKLDAAPHASVVSVVGRRERDPVRPIGVCCASAAALLVRRSHWTSGSAECAPQGGSTV